MGIRMSGLISGMDTDAIIKELMSAQTMKKTKIERKKTKADWAKDKWAELNTKLYNLYTKQLNKVKMQGTYKAKKVTSSNESAVTATASSSAASGSHTVDIKKLASSQYLTSGKLKGEVTSSTKLAGADGLGMDEGNVITVKAGETTKSLTITADTTVKDFVKVLSEAGLNAEFDEKQGRFFVSSKESGEKNAFSLTINSIDPDSDLGKAREALKAAMGGSSSTLNSFYDSYSSALDNLKKKQEAFDNSSSADRATAKKELEAAQEKVDKLKNDLIDQRKETEEQRETGAAQEIVAEKYVDKLKTDSSLATTYQGIVDSVNANYYDSGTTNFSQAAKDKAEAALKAEDSSKTYTAAEIDAKAEAMRQEELDAALMAEGRTYAKSAAAQTEVQNELANTAGSDFQNMYKKLYKEDHKGVAAAGKAVEDAITQYESALENGSAASGPVVNGQLDKLGLTNIVDGQIADANKTDNQDGSFSLDLGDGSKVTLVQASDAEIVFDGAVLTGDSNTFTAAGFTMQLNSVTNGKVTLSATIDTDSVYNSIKDFVKEYNNILGEMNKLYNADSARGYEPLSDEEKEAMSDDQVKLWEDKIKDSLLRRDNTLGSLIDTMRSTLQSTVTIDGKSYSLATFGIMTSSDYTEKGLLHIFGDEDDTTYAEETNKLKAALAEDPELVEKVLSGVMGNLSDVMMNKMKGTSLSSALTFYNDKEMKKTIKGYEDDIKKWEAKLQEIEERYYKQFSAMEVALSKLNSQSNYLASMLGTSGQ